MKRASVRSVVAREPGTMIMAARLQVKGGSFRDPGPITKWLSMQQPIHSPQLRTRAQSAFSKKDHFASRLVKAPVTLLKAGSEAMKAMASGGDSLKVAGIPNSVDTLAPNNRFVLAINTLPIRPGIPFHSIMGDRGKGGNKDHTRPVNSDGVVPYWSSHLEGAQSELIVPSGHSAHQNPQAIAEVRRILRAHAGN